MLEALESAKQAKYNKAAHKETTARQKQLQQTSKQLLRDQITLAFQDATTEAATDKQARHEQVAQEKAKVAQIYQQENKKQDSQPT